VALATAQDDCLLQLAAPYRLSRAYCHRGDFQQGIPLLTQMVESLTGDLEYAFLGFSLPLAVASRILLTYALAMCGAFPEGLTHAKEAARIVEAVDHPWSHMFAAQALAWLSLAKGDFPPAIAAFERILALGQRADIPGIFPEIAAALGLAYAWSGRVTQALPLVEQALARHQVMTEMPPASGLVLHLGHVYLLAGRLDEGNQLCQASLGALP